MNTNKLLNIFIVIFFAMTAFGCFHDDEDKSVDVSIINGTWFGIEEDVNNGGELNKIRFTILNGRITLVEREDQATMTMVDQKIIGSVTAKTATTWSYTLSDDTDTVGGFYVDTSATHLTFLDDQFKFGVMEKAATDDPERVYVDNDSAANWSGFSVNVQNGSMLAIDNFGSNIQIEMDTLAFVGADAIQSVTGGDFAGNLSLNDAMKGRYVGNWTNPLVIDTPPSGSLVSYMSADKTFLAARLCLPFITPPGNGVPNLELCSFAAWSK